MSDSLATLVVRLEAESSRYASELDKANKKLAGFAKSSEDQITKIAKAAGAAALAAAAGFAALTKSAIDGADELNDMSKATGLSVESLSQLKYATKLSGTDIDGLADGLRKLNSAAFDAAKGVKGPAESFDQLGIKVTDASGKIKSTEELLLETADVFSQYEDGAAKAAIAQDLFGKSGTALIPFLNQGRAGIEALKKEADAFGNTVSGRVAAAADEFNDNLSKLKAQADGFANQLAAQMLPVLNAFAADAADAAQRSETLAAAAHLAGDAFKVLASAGVVVTSAFQQVGQVIYSTASAAFDIAHGRFKDAADEISAGFAQARDNVAADFETINRIWSDNAASIVATVKATDDQFKKSMLFGGGDGLEEIRISAQKLDTTPTEKFYEELNNLTKTDTERKVSAFHQQQEALEALWDAGRISADQYNERSSAALDELLPQFETTAKKIKEAAEKQTDLLTEFQKEAARNTQDIIADTLENGFDDGLKGVADAFGQMIVKLSAQAVAADLAGKLFGKAGGGTGDGWLSTAASAIAGYFGGPRANGGPVSANEAYLVGERGPEMFVPSGAGKIVPNHGMGGNVTQNNTFILNQPTSRQTQQQVAAAASRGLQQANRRNN